MYQLMMLHLSAEPNLTTLPEEDRPIVGRALAKRAEDRFPSCLDFMQALVCGDKPTKPDLPRRAAVVKKIVSALHSSAQTPSKLIESDFFEPDPPENSPRPPPGACPTVPTNLDSADSPTKTPSAGTGATVPSTALEDKDVRPTRSARVFSAGSTPTCVSLPGYRFLHCVGQMPLGDIWKAEDKEGRPRRALCLPSFVEPDPTLIERLQSLNHPLLPATEVAWSPSGRLVLVSEECEQTLRDRLEVCQKQGLPGIPREELLGYLYGVAEALDTLFQQHNLPHLGLNPRVLMLRAESVRMLDYGLVPLVWLPTGQTAGSLNGRYAAPELFDKANLTGIPAGEAARAALMGRAGSTADQFSLALIYAEMVNGIAPPMPRCTSPAHRRSARRIGRPDSGLVPLRGQARVDFDLLPACDRAVLVKALDDDPQQRFATCTALVEALQAAASTTARRANLYQRLPAVIPFPSLLGEPPPKDIVLPPVNQVVLNLAMPTLAAPLPPRTIQGPQNIRYVLQGDGVWESKCPVQIFSGALALKVEGFRDEWRARVVEHKSNGFVFHIDLQPPPRPGERDSAASCLAVELDVQSAPGSAKYFAEARMRVFPVGGDRERLGRFLPELAPRLFDSLRRYLQAGPEQRSEDRWQCPQPLHVYPVLPDLELDEILDGISRNISLGGVSFRVAQAPAHRAGISALAQVAYCFSVCRAGAHHPRATDGRRRL